MRTKLAKAAMCGAVSLAAMLTTMPALAQGQGSSSGSGRDWVQSRDPMDPYDRYIMELRGHAREGGRIGERLPDDRMAERHGREQFERGYRAGREEERRRRALQGSGGEGRSASSGGGGEVERYWIVPNILPDTPRFRGMQDYALIPDYGEPMERLFAAAQGLREAIQAAAQIPASDRRNRAIDLLHEALLETQQAMALIPPDQRTR